jgi:hypothetical protein
MKRERFSTGTRVLHWTSIREPTRAFFGIIDEVIDLKTSKKALCPEIIKQDKTISTRDTNIVQRRELWSQGRK